MNNQKLSDLKNSEGREGIKQSVINIIERLNKNHEIQQKLMSNLDYITWLEEFTTKYPEFSDETWLYCQEEISQQEREQITSLQFLYAGIEEYAKQHNIEREKCCFGGFYNIKYNNIGYIIGQLAGQGTVDFCKRVSLDDELEASKFIDFYDIMIDKQTSLNELKTEAQVKSNPNQPTVIFYRYGKSYYYKLSGKVFKVDVITISKLKEKLVLPFKVAFTGLARAQIGRVINDLLDNDMDVKINKITTRNELSLKYEAIFTHTKRKVSVFQIPSLKTLYTLNSKASPFVYTNINNQYILLEVTKDYVKTNPGNYYFLATDLTEQERTFFDIVNQQLECDHIYRFDNSLTKSKSRIKRKTIKR